MELTAWASLWQDADGWQPPTECVPMQRITGRQLQHIVQCCPPDKAVGADGNQVGVCGSGKPSL
eukprot:3474120-Amphidinium_carterae.1